MMPPTAEIGTPLDVLLIDDSPHYIRLLKEAFRDVNARVHFHVAGDGLEALAFLRRQGPMNLSAPRPDLILLDLGMPRMNGCEFLATLKQDADLKTIPTVVLTTSEMREDIASTFKLHANAYLQKPLRLDQLDTLIKSINEFWFSQCTLPEKQFQTGPTRA
jgi:two-component system, chemotaxis family, response regulator Rcp1